MNKERFGKFIRAKRTQSGSGRREFAASLEISEPFLKDIEGGRSRPAAERLFDWAKVLQVDPKVLFEELEEPFPLEETPQDLSGCLSTIRWKLRSRSSGLPSSYSTRKSSTSSWP
jgi:transcriptional regulator with XRE-family HTH domain